VRNLLRVIVSHLRCACNLLRVIYSHWHFVRNLLRIAFFALSLRSLQSPTSPFHFVRSIRSSRQLRPDAS
jgi:hypothetical protein